MDVGVWVDVVNIKIWPSGLGFRKLDLMHTNKSGEEELILLLTRGDNLHSDLRIMAPGLNGVDINPTIPIHEFDELILITAVPVPTLNAAISSRDP